MIQYFVKYSIGVISEEIKIKIHHDNIDKSHCLGLKTLTEKNIMITIQITFK